MLASTLARLNHAAIWHRSLRVGQDRLRATSLDRLVYLCRWRWLESRNGELSFLRSLLRPGMQVVDAGANLGAYSHLFARSVGPQGRVIAFEPDPLLFAALVANAKINRLAQIQPHQLALGDRPGTGRLRSALLNSGDNRLSAGVAGSKGIETKIVTLDEFLAGKPVDFIKLDIQGWELHALRGMVRTLAENPGVRLYLELWPYGLAQAGSSSDELLAFLTEHGFEFEGRPGGSPQAPAALLKTSARGARQAGRASWFMDIHAWRP